MSSKKKRKNRPLLVKIIVPMIILSMVQVVSIVVIMNLSGEFSYIKEFSYKSLSEKTENRRNYVENVMNQKTSLVYETADTINETTDRILREENLSAAAVKENRALNKRILSETAAELISLIRRDMVNDAFIILNSGTLYNEGDLTKMAGVYLRDTDVNENSISDNHDIYMEMGSSEIAHDLGLPLDYGWSLYMDMTDSENVNYDFFYDTIEGYDKHSEIPIYQLGRWSGFNGGPQSKQHSMKYSIPLVSEDGTVYGVVGIGLLEKTVLQSIPANDFFDESACYILAADFEANGKYERLLSSGPAYNRLVDEETVLSREHDSEYGLYDFTSKGAKCIGSIQDITLYTSRSPFYKQKWALISVADKEKTLNIYTTLVWIFFISVGITLAVGVIIAFIVSRRINLPVTKMLSMLEDSRQRNTLVQFESSGISEMDSLGDSIAELQVKVMEYASRVSKIITMAGSQIGVFMYDINSQTVFVGESLIKLLGFTSLPDQDVTISAEEFRSQLSVVDKENKVLDLEFFKEGEEVHSSGRSVEIMNEDAQTGELRWFQFNLTGDNANVIGLVQDITNTVAEKRQIAEKKDDEYTEKLLKANEVLRDAYAVAKQANSAKTDFLSRMSHDIRTPMNAIIGMTTVAEAHLDDKERVKDCLKKIGVSSQYLLYLINEVLDMGKIESGKFVLSEENVNLLNLVDNTVEVVHSTIKEKNHELKVDIKEIEHENVIGDGVRIQQVLVNILNNAAKYTPHGGHIQMIVAEKPFYKNKIGCFEFVIRDDGIGMSQEFLERLYEPFERASDVRVNKEMGTGLGMVITKNIVEMMDGDIQVESEVGKGTTFTVTVTLKLQEEKKVSGDGIDGEENEDSSLDRINDSDFSGERVLLVDDIELNREVVCEILGMTGLEIDTAENGKEAVDKFSASEEGYYKMIFMDIQMPVMNGYEAVKNIRAMSRADAKTIPIIAMTADAFVEDVKASKKAGMNEHIAKPVDFDRLMEILNQWLK